MSLNRSVLVINASYEPLTVTSARRAMTLICKGAAIVQKPSKHIVRTAHLTIQIPSVIRLINYRRVPRISRSVSRKGILLRDGFVCQYCGVRFQVGDLTMDHVIPKSRGGANSWENLVTCCFPCNNRKGNRTPEEAGMTLLKRPIQLSIHSKHKMLQSDQAEWSEFLFA